tara:strand:+ start:269 stop:793 length:525 start_codon:yes stop_codon:yes gene_type:complete
MAGTYEIISTQTLGTAEAIVTFSSIPQTYTDLVFVTQSRASTAGVNDKDIGIRFNGDASSVYSRTTLSGNGSTATSFRATGNNVVYGAQHPLSSGTANVLGVATWNIMNYSQADTYKTVLVRSSCDGASVNDVRTVVGLWRGTIAGITSLSLILASGGSFAVGSTFSLYGIKAA